MDEEKTREGYRRKASGSRMAEKASSENVKGFAWVRRRTQVWRGEGADDVDVAREGVV